MANKQLYYFVFNFCYTVQRRKPTLIKLLVRYQNSHLLRE